ncbi:MAG: response regulator transcription factor [Bacteroidales bacterium]|nr:response regulator transcription factor [Bacteroidales bacterium]
MTDAKSLINDFKKIFSARECLVFQADYDEFVHKRHLLKQLAEVENSSMSVFDMNKGEYTFVRSKFDSHLFYPVNDIFKREPSYFFELMPKPDLVFTLDTTVKAFNFLKQLDKDNLKEYKLVFEFRLSDPAGNLYRFLQQCVVLEQDKSGNIWMVLILNDMIPNKTGENKLLRKMIHLPTGKICLFQEEFEQKSKSFLSKRETEIIGLLSQGLQSKEISDKLFISINTVNNHRQKIIEKLNVENTYEALRFAKTIGIV